MISLFDKDNTTFTGNGNVVLTPTEGKIRMVAGGSYDLTMRHPMDPEGKWRHLVPGAIVRAPVPEEEIENAFAGLDADVYKVTTAGDLREGPTAPSTISYPAWSETTAAQGGYSVGSKVTFGSKNYECTYMDAGSIVARVIPSQSAWWSEIPRTNPGSPVLVTLPVGTELYFVEDVDSTWCQMSTYYGVEGYVEKAKVTYDRHLTPSETKPRIITEQLLRITNATVDTKSRTVSVTAEHVSNDLTGVIVRDVSISQASPALALTRITDSFMIPYQGTIATNLDSETNGTYTNDIKGKNGTYCMLDPDKGIVSTFDAALKRDNWDLFILKKTNTNRGFQLRRGKNILGVNWARKSDGMINRVVPVAKDAGGADLYLPEVWIDSPTISDYPVIRMEMLSMKEQVGKDKGTGDGSTWTEADLLAEMRKRAGERFSVDKADLIVTEVTVDFEMQGVTEEYPELRKLQNVLLYDTVTVIEDDAGLDTALTVTELEWDIIKEKVTALKLSNAEEKGGKNVSGYNVQPKSIGWSKLTDEVQQGIMGAVKDIIPEYADPDAPRPVSVTDSDPTLAWGTRSKVGTVQGTDLHVTMPANPAPGVIDNLNSTSSTDALSANQGNVLNGSIRKIRNPVVYTGDLDSINETCIVYATTATHSPGVYCLVFTMRFNANDMAQTAYSIAYNNVYYRKKSKGTWGAWNELAFTDDIPAVINNCISTSTTDALSAYQGKVLNDQFVDHWGKNYGNSQNPIADLADLPVNGGGIVTMAASLSPNGSLSVFSFEKLGNANRYTVKLTRIRNNSTYESYIGEMYDGTFLGWIRTPNGIVDNLTSTSTTDALSANQGKVLDENISKKANKSYTRWGTSIEVPAIHALVFVAYGMQVLVWLPETNGIDIGVFSTTGGFTKTTTTNSITFSGSSASGTDYTITRSGNTFTLTSTANRTLTAIYA